jgi:hypothetical protein
MYAYSKDNHTQAVVFLLGGENGVIINSGADTDISDHCKFSVESALRNVSLGENVKVYHVYLALSFEMQITKGC